MNNKHLLSLLLILMFSFLFSQNIDIQKDSIEYKNVKSYYLLFSKKGDSHKKKPLFFFCQGSLPRPLLREINDNTYTLLPFNIETITEKYHLIMVNKPALPLSEKVENLTSNLSFPNPPKQYMIHNNLPFYYKRNNRLIRKLIKEKWIDKNKIVVAGHSEGAYIALEMAIHYRKISHLIYSGGNPLGRMMSIINQDRNNPKEKESWVNDTFTSWQKIIANKNNIENQYFYTYSLSQNFLPKLLKLKIPVLVTYGTKGQNAIFNDYLQIETIREGKENFTFKPYFNCDHNFFPIDKNGKINHKVKNWKNVVQDWTKWLK